MPGQERLDELRLRSEHEASVYRAPERRPSVVTLRGNEEVQRADGPRVRAPVPIAGDWFEVLHRIWSLRTTGYGSV